MSGKHALSRVISGMPGALSPRVHSSVRLPMLLCMGPSSQKAFYTPGGCKSAQTSSSVLNKALGMKDTSEPAAVSRQIEIAEMSSSNVDMRDDIYSERAFGPLSSAARELQQSFASNRADPYRILEQHLESENAVSLDVIRICLGAMHREFFKAPRMDRAELIRTKNFGVARRVMLRIIDESNVWLQLVINDQRACSMLCYFAIAENIDNLIVDWIKITDINDELLHLLNDTTPGRPNMFRSMLLRALIVAHTMAQATRSMDRGLSCLRDIVAWQQSHMDINHERRLVKSSESISLSGTNSSRRKPTTDAALFSVFPAAIYLASGLCTAFNYETDPVLFDWFVAWIPSCESRHHGAWEPRSKLALQFMTARLVLYHPVSPDSRPFISMLRAIRTTSKQGDIVEIPRQSIERPFRKYLQRAYIVSKALARHDETIWLKQVYKNTFSEPLRVENPADTKMPPNWSPSSG